MKLVKLGKEELRVDAAIAISTAFEKNFILFPQILQKISTITDLLYKLKYCIFQYTFHQAQ